MPHALIFIDANIYLKLYKVIEGRALLEPLRQFADSILVTRQVVDEVERNKLKVAATFFADRAKTFNPGISDHLFEGEPNSDKLREQVETAANLRKTLDKLFKETIEKVARSEDEVSRKLEPLFALALKATPEQLERARARRECGNPPGKCNQPLGDQITWEQILGNACGVKHFFLVAEDRDYFTEYKGKHYLNPLLHKELAAASKTSVHVRCTADLQEALREFAAVTSAPTDTIPTGARAKEIDKEMAPPTFGYDGMADEIAIRNRWLHQTRTAALIASVAAQQSGNFP
ncbi:MAG TPA: PIN domain-containing protein [Pirellulales bacterium]|nr:PIN domain-containing protein [Pirellulales bacterium]